MLEIIIPNHNAKVYWYHLKDLPVITHEAAVAAAEMDSVKYCEGNLGRTVCILSYDKRQMIYGGVRRNVACLIYPPCNIRFAVIIQLHVMIDAAIQVQFVLYSQL